MNKSSFYLYTEIRNIDRVISDFSQQMRDFGNILFLQKQIEIFSEKRDELCEQFKKRYGKDFESAEAFIDFEHMYEDVSFRYASSYSNYSIFH